MIVIKIFSHLNLGCVLSSSSGGGSASSGRARSDTASDVRNELGDINVLESTSEKTGPEGLTVDLGRLNLFEFLSVKTALFQVNFVQRISANNFRYRQ